MKSPRPDATAPFSIRLDASVRMRLEEEARRADRSASYVATKAIEAFLDTRAEKRRAIEAAIVEADRGLFVSSEAVAAWMASWGTETELPAPAPDLPLDRRGA